MQILNYLSIFLIPFVIFYILLYALFHKKPAFELFTSGGKKGIEIVIDIAPTIVGFFVAVGVLRSSGTLDLLCRILQPFAEVCHVPAPILPLSLLKLFSASGSNGLLFDIFKTYGTDSYIGFTASILLGCTETLFYTVAIYYMSVNVKKTRWTIPAGIGIAFFSLLVSSFIAGICA